MPSYWTRMPTNTAESLRGLSPADFRREVHRIVTRNGAGLDAVFFDASGRYAYALIHDVRDGDIEAISEQVEGHETIKLLTVEEVEEQNASE